MNKIKFVLLAISFPMLSCCACTEEEPRKPAEQPETPVEKPETQPEAMTIQITSAVPEAYFRAAEQKGTVEVIEYELKDYTGSMAPTTKPAYVYLPYGYDISF